MRKLPHLCFFWGLFLHGQSKPSKAWTPLGPRALERAIGKKHARWAPTWCAWVGAE